MENLVSDDDCSDELSDDLFDSAESLKIKSSNGDENSLAPIFE